MSQRLRELSERIGEEVEGRVTFIASSGAFLDLGGADGLLHKSDIGFGEDTDLTALLWVGRVLKVRVLSVDLERKRVALSLRNDADDPWPNVPARYPKGRVLRAKVLKPLELPSGFCLFVELEPGVDALLLPSDLPAGKLATDFATDAWVYVEIVEVDAEQKRVRARMDSA